MGSFINEVLTDLYSKNVDFSKLTFVLPSKRAGTFLINELSHLTSHTLIAPKIFSIEEFVEELAQINKQSSVELLFELYRSYKNIFGQDLENFESFSKWAQILLQDFNEIDRHLVNPSQLFNYLSAIQEVNSNHWSLEENKSTLVKNYLKFWNKLEVLYYHFKDDLLDKKFGYQGLIYREAYSNLETFIQENIHKKFIFLGFNALNEAEIGILKELLHSDIASVYWDIDKVFVENKYHDAGHFIRKHKTWKYYNNHSFNWLSNSYKNNKDISVIGIPKNVGQAKYIGELLSELKMRKKSLDNTALVLGNESLLFPILTSMPKEVDSVNITMGIPLKSIPISSLFEQLIVIQKDTKTKFYYKDVISLISNSTLSSLFKHQDNNSSQKLVNIINKNNFVYLTKQEICDLLPEKSNILSLLFSSWKDNVEMAINSILEVIYTIKEGLDVNKSQNALTLEYLYKFNTIFNAIKKLNSTYSYIDSIKSFYSIYKELLNSETLDFKGEPLKGLQIMGMLESRVLDFETVIISGVNEGILPSGKSNNSFIPFDVKLEHHLPTYKEKDAIYTYHFYHLLQRAKEVYILYNTEPDALNGGEKSRFITQLEIEGIHKINQTIVTPKTPHIKKEYECVKKTENVISQVKKIAEKGFSPSALTSYIRNPMDFYYQRVLEIYDHKQVEETIETNTLGTVVHNTLEEIYTPFVGDYLTIEGLNKKKKEIEFFTKKHFKKEYKKGDISKGKNLISFEIAKRYVLNFINSEIRSLKDDHSIKILALEDETSIEINIPELNFPIKLKGKVDRIDICNGITRIIDYKTGNVVSSQVEIVNWEDITTDYKKYSKSFQVLTYTLIQYLKNNIDLPVEAGIISFKNLSNGFLKFAKKDSPRSRQKDNNITKEKIESFSTELKKLIVEICNPEIDFIEKEV